jgi:microsomal epoxide hydrolase
MSTFKGSLEVRPFKAAVSEDAIVEFKQLLHLSKIGPTTFENSDGVDSSYGLSRKWLGEAKEHWANTYDWYASQHPYAYEIYFLIRIC